MRIKRLVLFGVVLFATAVVSYRSGWDDGYHHGYRLATVREMISEGYDLKDVATALREE